MKAGWASPRAQRLALTAGAVLLLALAARMVIGPAWERWRQARGHIVRDVETLERHQRLLASQEPIRRQYQAVAAYGVEIGSDETELTDLLQQLELAATQTGVRVTDLKPRAATTPTAASAGAPGARLVAVEMDAEGSMAALIQLLQTLRQGKLLVRVDRLRVNALDQPGVLRFNMVLAKVILP